ncbi:MAG TPA: polysaccharide deacetylase family protein [Bacillales bacterium]|nr:polysaccharide deacetylase family protein [Bacillales bacterium]
MRKQLLHWAVFVTIFLISFGTVGNPWTSRYLHDIKRQSTVAVNQQSPLYKKIEAAAKKYNEPAVNARLDPVWKAIPGYDGIKVDVTASYQKMKRSGGFRKDDLVFHEVKPKVHLEDLAPAPIFKGNPEKPMVSLMINVAWGNEYIPKILKTLDEEHVHATFFLDGSWIKKNPELAKMIAEEGNEIGNHAYSHPDMKSISAAAARSQIEKTNAIIHATLNMTPDLFAPPSGSWSPQVVQVADGFGMKTILWTVDTIDWKKPNPAEMVQRVLQQVQAGNLILMHPTASTAAGLKSLIQGIRARGYQLGTVSTLLSEDRL